jgi:predicted DNA-binding transcriptional regulator AlpA
MTNDTTMIGPNEFRELLKISRAQFYRLKASGRLPAPVRFGRLCRWLLAEVLAWLRAEAPPRERWDDIKGDWGFPNGGR